MFVCFFASHQSFSFLQVIAHHPMQSISFASGGDTVSAAFNSAFFCFQLAIVVVVIAAVVVAVVVVRTHFGRLHISD